MNQAVSTIRPGLLVSLKTSLSGNVHYSTQDIERAHKTSKGSLKSKWTTEKTIADPAEQEAAEQARSLARAAVRRVCAASAFGLICLESDQDELEAAVQEAEKHAREFNSKAKLSRLEVNILVGRIEADDVRAIKAINSEMRDLIDTMQNGVKNLDVKSIRGAAMKMKSVAQVLTPAAQERAAEAIEAARKAARQIAKAGETAAVEVDLQAMKKIKEARTAFLDLGVQGEIKKTAAKVRAVDFEPATQKKSTTKTKRRQLEL